MPPKRRVSSKKLTSLRRIIISEEEFSTGVTSLDNVQAGVEEFQTHGFVILENAIPNNIVDKLRTQMLTDAATCHTFPDLVFNHGKENNNFSITPPLYDEFLLEDIWANRHATAIIQQIIGPKPLLCWASSNVAIKSGSDARQTVHSDAYADIPNFPFCVEMNIYLQDTTPENGSTEIWPGTHVYTEDDHLPHGRGYIKKKAFTDRARISPPIQPTVPAGSILMRDLRLWHSGMPNTSSTPRIIVALIYFPQWFRPHMRLTLPASVRTKAEAWTHIDLLSNTDFVEGSVDYLHTHFPMNFTQDPAKGLVEYRRAVDKLQGREPGAHIPVTRDNYWMPSRYQTRAAGKRKRQTEGDDDGENKRLKQEEAKSRAKPQIKQEQDVIQEPEIKQEVDAKQELEIIPQPESRHEVGVKPEADGKQEHEIGPAGEPKVAKRPWLRYEQTTQEPKVKHDPEQDTNSIDDLPDYEDSPIKPPSWMVKLQGNQNKATKRQSWDIDSGDYDASVPYDHAPYFSKNKPMSTQQPKQEQKGEVHHEAGVKHKTEPEQDTNQFEDLPDYQDSPVSNVFSHLDNKEAQEQDVREEEWISAIQKRTFKLDFVTSAGGPGISPQYSPKSKPGSPREPNTTQKEDLEKREESLEKLLHENRLHEKQLQDKEKAEPENQEPMTIPKQQAAPVAKMTPDPEPQQPAPHSPKTAQQ